MTAPAFTFDQNALQTWTAMFPEFAGAQLPQAQGWWLRAGLIFANDTNNQAFQDGTLQTLLFLLTAHIAWLNAPRGPTGAPAASGQPAPDGVGRVSNASEGSVSVALEWKGDGGPSEEWFSQTRYGAEFWAATSSYRQFRYAARPTFARRVFAGWPLRTGGGW